MTDMDYISKTQKKREAVALQDLGEKLVKLSKEQLAGIDLTDELLDAVLFAKTIKSHGALKRQMQFIGTLMRKTDSAPVEEAINNIEEGDYKKAAEFKATEKWRDELIAGDKICMEEILSNYPSAERRQLTQLVRNAAKERENNKPPRASRALFRYLAKIKKSKC